MSRLYPSTIVKRGLLSDLWTQVSPSWQEPLYFLIREKGRLPTKLQCLWGMLLHPVVLRAYSFSVYSLVLYLGTVWDCIWCQGLFSCIYDKHAISPVLSIKVLTLYVIEQLTIICMISMPRIMLYEVSHFTDCKEGTRDRCSQRHNWGYYNEI